MPSETDFNRMLCADIDGFSLQAAVRCGADTPGRFEGEIDGVEWSQ